MQNRPLASIRANDQTERDLNIKPKPDTYSPDTSALNFLKWTGFGMFVILLPLIHPIRTIMIVLICGVIWSVFSPEGPNMTTAIDTLQEAADRADARERRAMGIEW